MASIYLYKTSTIPSNTTVRYEITNLESLNITMDQPVSPMALPQEDANENILVKMEGNTETVNITWKIPDVGASLIRKEDSVLDTGVIQDDSTGTTPVNWDSTPAYLTSGSNIAWFLNEFQGRNISDRYFIKIPEITIREGFVTKSSFTISGDTPVVWQGNIQLIVGNVISIYDADTPSEVRNAAASQVDSGGDTVAEGGGTADRIRLRWAAPTDSTTTVASYKIYRGSDSTSFVLTNTLTDSGLDGAVSGNNSYKELAVTGLTAGREYYFKISAVNTGGEGLKSDKISTKFPPS